MDAVNCCVKHWRDEAEQAASRVDFGAALDQIEERVDGEDGVDEVEEKHIVHKHSEAVFAVDKAERGEEKSDGDGGEVERDRSHKVENCELTAVEFTGVGEAPGVAVVAEKLNQGDRRGDCH